MIHELYNFANNIILTLQKDPDNVTANVIRSICWIRSVERNSTASRESVTICNRIAAKRLKALN